MFHFGTKLRHPVNQMVQRQPGADRLGKHGRQSAAQNTKVQVLIGGELKECALVFTNNGSDFHLEPVK